MTEKIKRLRDEMALDKSETCFCAGGACSGCEENTKKVFKYGFDAAWALHVRLVAPLIEYIAERCSYRCYYEGKHPNCDENSCDVLKAYKSEVGE